MIQKASNLIQKASAILIGAGAGMGVDSGLPDFRSKEGFWKNYPPYKKLGLNFHDLANPSLFRTNPRLAWGFYYHRKMLYERTRPHYGFEILKQWASKINNNIFIYTSNVDGQFQKAGFDENKIIEIHGNINRLQCLNNCKKQKFFIPETLELDKETMMISGHLPFCVECATIARPNVLMFHDYSFDKNNFISQYTRYNLWLESLQNQKLVILEIGAGRNIPTVRMHCDSLSSKMMMPNIRINLNECDKNTSNIQLPARALDVLQQIDERIKLYVME